MENIVGDVEVDKFRHIDINGISSEWKYRAYSPNIKYSSGRIFGERDYKHLNDMAQDIALISTQTEEVMITPGNSKLKVNKGKAMQYSHLDNDELQELTKQILLLRVKNRLEVVAQH